jgi:predicted N-acetyltransferase YhbS
MPELLLRDARAGDAPAIRAVTIAAYQQYAALIPRVWRPYRDNILETLANPAPAEQIVAERDGAILGAVLLFPPGTGFEQPAGAEASPLAPDVRLLAVVPAARGQGVGGALMQACLRRAQAAGHASVTLHTMDVMVVAKAMYERLGFVPAHELDFEPVPGFFLLGYRYRFQ